MHLFCVCSMPECYDSDMISCEQCQQWYHYKCVGIDTIIPDVWLYMLQPVSIDYYNYAVSLYIHYLLYSVTSAVLRIILTVLLLYTVYSLHPI